jgi:hypothetical protein
MHHTHIHTHTHRYMRTHTMAVQLWGHNINLQMEPTRASPDKRGASTLARAATSSALHPKAAAMLGIDVSLTQTHTRNAHGHPTTHARSRPTHDCHHSRCYSLHIRTPHTRTTTATTTTIFVHHPLPHTPHHPLPHTPHHPLSRTARHLTHLTNYVAPLTARHPSLTTHHAPLTTHHAPLTIHQPPPHR